MSEYREAWEGLTPTSRGELVLPGRLPAVEALGRDSWASTQRRVATGQLQPVRRGVYAHGVTDTERDAVLRALAALKYRLQPGFVVVGHSAAILLGLWTGWRDRRVHVSLPGQCSGKSRLDGTLVRHFFEIPPDQMRTHEGLLVTSMERTAVDCARGQPLARALPTLDSALAIGVERDEIVRILERMTGYRGVRSARSAVAHAHKTGSPLESTVRGELVTAGLPSPEPLIKLGLPDDSRLELDMGWRRIRLAVEAHGQQKYLDGALHAEDENRRAKIKSAGWAVVDVRSTDTALERQMRVERAFRTAFLRVVGKPWELEV